MITALPAVAGLHHSGFVHVLVDGRIIKTGDKKLALQLEERGYDHILDEHGLNGDNNDNAEVSANNLWDALYGF